MKQSNNIEILCRYKNSTGDKTIGYRVKIGNEVKYIKAEDMYKIEPYIVNAYRTKTGEFKAKNNCAIKTEVLRCNIQEYQKPDKVEKDSSYERVLDVDFLQVCRDIRSLALSKKVKVDNKPYKSKGGNCLDILKIAKSCGYEIEEYIAMYLSNIQPCCLKVFRKSRNRSVEEILATHIIVYNTEMIINILLGEGGERIGLNVSFREISSTEEIVNSIGYTDNENKYTLVFIDNISEFTMNGIPKYTVKYTLTRGFITLSGSSVVDEVHSDYAIVPMHDIRKCLNWGVRELIETIEKHWEYGKVRKISSITPNISFISYCDRSTNTICLLAEMCNAGIDGKTLGLFTSMVETLIQDIPKRRLKEMGIILANKFGKLRNNKLLRIFEDVMK